MKDALGDRMKKSTLITLSLLTTFFIIVLYISVIKPIQETAESIENVVEGAEVIIENAPEVINEVKRIDSIITDIEDSTGKDRVELATDKATEIGEDARKVTEAILDGFMKSPASPIPFITDTTHAKE